MKRTEPVMSFKNYKMCLHDAVESFTRQLVNGLFDAEYFAEKGENTRKKFLKILERLTIENAELIWDQFQESFTEIRMQLDSDAVAALTNDPAAKSLEEVYLAYPGFYAISVYRLSNKLFQLNIPVLPRMMSEFAHSTTGTDIHPGATIGDSFFIDHATGIVIGESAIIKDHVKIFQGVTLGGISVKKSLTSTKRHPTIESNVTIYANATILGGDVVVGANSVVGANVCITASVPENSVVIAHSENKIVQKKS